MIRAGWMPSLRPSRQDLLDLTLSLCSLACEGQKWLFDKICTKAEVGSATWRLRCHFTQLLHMNQREEGMYLMCVHHVCDMRGSEEDVSSPGTGVTGRHVSAGNKTHVLWKSNECS